jgi:hypothetical protein
VRADAVRRGDIVDGQTVLNVSVDRRYANVRTAEGVTRYHRGANVEVTRQGEQGTVTL